MTPAADGQPAAEPAEIPRRPPHEIFADSEPPDPLFEAPPRAPGTEYMWTPGFWDFNGQRWEWHAGMWRPRLGSHFYAPPHYEIVKGRVVYVRPHWSAREPQRSYGGRLVLVRQAARPAWYRSGIRVSVPPSPGVRIGTRPAARYLPAGRPNRHLEIPPRPTVPADVVRLPPVRVSPGPPSGAAPDTTRPAASHKAKGKKAQRARKGRRR